MALFAGTHNGFGYRGSYQVRDGVIIWSVNVQSQNDPVLALHGRFPADPEIAARLSIEREVNACIERRLAPAELH
ncbi:hypothetical protein SAMN04487785_116119 [Dyella jiangningensis]|uniref:hypothetical protein n=1 Tax=Dyella sp. AtDHG13 TaxID=1938897 RepID=UPI00088C05D6|nr:hypothetical protein [Dyella sp. AtDHG13]PXV53595.1 hypothetical protein BDW41_1142 [Dyella sp. AtDHG13]SDL24830.1 hypothetical protein SAMN04487785_116119 [Dyella jiangningensis]